MSSIREGCFASHWPALNDHLLAKKLETCQAMITISYCRQVLTLHYGVWFRRMVNQKAGIFQHDGKAQ